MGSIWRPGDHISAALVVYKDKHIISIERLCTWPQSAVLLKNFHVSSDICPMGFIYFIQNCEISHQTFGPSHWKCLTCPMIFMNTESVSAATNFGDRTHHQI